MKKIGDISSRQRRLKAFRSVILGENVKSDEQIKEELIEQKRQQIMSSYSSDVVRDDLLEQLSEIESIASTLSPTELETRIKSIKSKYELVYVR